MTSRAEQRIEIRNELNVIWDNMGNNPAKALSDSKQIAKRSQSIEFEDGVKEARFHICWCLIFLSRLKEAITILLDLASEYKNEDLSIENIKILNALGVAYKDLGDNTNAFYYYSRSLKLSREANLLDRELSVLNNMGRYYLENKNYDKALNHYIQILDKAENSKDTEESLEIKIAVIINIGICYSKLQQYEESEKYLQQSLNLTRLIENRHSEVESLYELARIKYKQNKIDSAKEYILNALEICKDSENKRTECDLLIMSGDIENDKTQYEKALDLSTSINYKPVYKNCCKKLGEYYEKIGDYKQSLKFIKEQYQIEKELNNLAAEKKFHNLEMEYEVERNRKNVESFKTQNIELKESLNWMSILNKIARETMSSLELDSIFDTVYQNINILMDAANFHVVFYDKQNDELNVVKAIENGNEIPPFTYNADINSSFAAWSIKNKKEILINNIQKEYKKYIKTLLVYGTGPKERSKSMITVPIFMRNREIGVMAILSYSTNAYKEEHVQLLKSLAAYLSIAIENSRNFEKVKELNEIILEEKKELEEANIKITELATHDSLTGLTNRRVFIEMLDSAMHQARRRGEILAILFIDVDNFKPINDTWGHDAGDKVLIEIACRFRKLLRSSDSVARIGGDEFLILLDPVKNKKEASKVAEKVRVEIKRPIILNEVSIEVGTSIGISLFSGQETTVDQLIINADSAMYTIKNNSKNAIGFFTED